MNRRVFLNGPACSLTDLMRQGEQLWWDEAGSRAADLAQSMWELSDRMTRGASTSAYSTGDKTVGSSARPDAQADELPRSEGHNTTEGPQFTCADSLCLLALDGRLVPEPWEQDGPHPYAGLLVSAGYFNEAKRFLAASRTDAAWAALVQAYYHLGTNSSAPTSHESARNAATKKHAEDTRGLRECIVEILAELARDATIKSGAKARRRVVETLIASQDPKHKAALERYERSTKNNPNLSEDISARLQDRLEEWSAPKSRYPEITAAFAPFKRLKA